MVERGEYMGCVGEDIGRGSSIPSHSLQFRRSLSPPTRAAGREQRREYMVMVVSEARSRNYPPRLYPEGFSNLEDKAINHNFRLGDWPSVRETIGLDVWGELLNSALGVVARLCERKSVWSGRTVHYLLCRQLRVEKKEIWSLVVDEPMRFSLLEFGEITGLNTGPLPVEAFEPDQYKEFLEELKVPLGVGPKLDELKVALDFCPLWSYQKRKWLGLLFLQAMGLYCLHHSSRIPFQGAIRVFDDESMRSYPWGRSAYGILADYLKTLSPEGGTYTISGMAVALQIWAYESVPCFEEEEGNEGWRSSEAEPPTKKQKKVNTSEGQAGATGKGSSEEPTKELLNNATMESIVSAVGKMIDSRFNAYGVKENIDNLSIASGEEGSSEKPSPQQDKHQKSINTPALNPAKPAKGLGPEKDFAEEVDNASGVKRILAADFDRANATLVKTSNVDFVIVSREKTCKDDKVANCPPLRRGTRIRQGLKLKDEDEAEDAAAKKKAAKAEAYLKKKEMDDSECAEVADVNEVLPESEISGQDLLALSVVRDFWERSVQLSPRGFELTAVDSSEPSGPVFPLIDNDGTTCMRKNIEPSTAIYDPCAPVDPSLYEKLMKHISSIPPKKPGPAGKKVVRSADHESDFYSILIHERPWPDSEYGWVFDNHIEAYMNCLIQRSMRDPTTFWSKRIAFFDPWILANWVHDYKQFKMKPQMMTFKEGGYKDLVNGRVPHYFKTNLKWYQDVDHVYGCIQTGRDHWVAFHVDLKKEKIDCYDPIVGEHTPESEERILGNEAPSLDLEEARLSSYKGEWAATEGDFDSILAGLQAECTLAPTSEDSEDQERTGEDYEAGVDKAGSGDATEGGDGEAIPIANDIRTRSKERRKSVGVVNPLKFLHLEALRIQEDSTIAVQEDIIRHLFKWVDECLVEEVKDIKPVIRGMNDDISFLILSVAGLGKEIEVIKTAHVRKRDECMRNVVVCGVGTAILCYYYFFL
ncbi:hypothetical protein Bca101_067756 [Brassica carinata]